MYLDNKYAQETYMCLCNETQRKKDEKERMRTEASGLLQYTTRIIIILFLCTL